MLPFRALRTHRFYTIRSRCGASMEGAGLAQTPVFGVCVVPKGIPAPGVAAAVLSLRHLQRKETSGKTGLDYMHNNPVTRRPASEPREWPWPS